ncbi:PspC domain-containing protein [Kitasatospora azatica]|uniref:PspC domain-containing protein n=1 Tax=Kitasatospora azatica TaxID=58347 RepID=UPI00055FB71F|nr:PspC domain-containing protein [Kitasatospora azatica]
MTEEQSTVPTDPGVQEQPADARPPLTRSEDHRVVAGVCGGLGRHLDIDPVVFRVVTAVLCLTGGLGLFLYGLAWLIVPTEHPDGKHGRTELQRVLTGRVDGQSIGAVLLTVIGTGVFFSWMDSGDSISPLLLLGALVFFAVRHDPERRRRARGMGTAPRPGGPYDRPTAGTAGAGPGAAGLGAASPLADWKTWRQDFHAEWTARKAGMHEEWSARKAEWDDRREQWHGHKTEMRAGVDLSKDAPADTPPSRTGYLWDPRHPERNPYGATPPPGTPAQAWWQRADLPEGDPLRKDTPPTRPDPARPAPAPARRERRSRSALAPLGLLAAAGASWAVWSANVHGQSTTVLLSTVLATGLLVLGLTILLGAKVGRARVLALPALVLTLALAGLGSSAQVHNNAIGDRTFAPAGAAAVQHEYVLGVGDLNLDLRAVDPAGSTVGTTVKLGTGDVHVMLPPNVAADLDLRTLVGNVSLPNGNENSGVGSHRKVHLDPVGGASNKGTIDLTIEVGLGDIQVVQG